MGKKKKKKPIIAPSSKRRSTTATGKGATFITVGNLRKTSHVHVYKGIIFFFLFIYELRTFFYYVIAVRTHPIRSFSSFTPQFGRQIISIFSCFYYSSLIYIYVYNVETIFDFIL